MTGLPTEWIKLADKEREVFERWARRPDRVPPAPRACESFSV
jgi:hypothetical protein